ncbi:MAG: PadR family transcriptional regulator [Candidatus Micrarchaeota archaeon]|nr:PadR family transcriptional regulator [Candidatus Micrarchaeota archaeon]
MQLANLNNLKFGNLGKVLVVLMEKESAHGYEIGKITGISLTTVYKLLPLLEEAKFIIRVDPQIIDSPMPAKKYFSLTDTGRELAYIYKSSKRD